MSSKAHQLAVECQRQFDNCLYTAASITIWLKALRCARALGVALSLVCGSFATWHLVKQSQDESLRLWGAVAAFVAGLVPTVMAALKFDDRIEQCRRLAGEFTNLRDRFRQCALVHSRKTYAEFESEFTPIMNRMDKARAETVATPELCFWLAQYKVKKGDYSFDVDALSNEADGGAPLGPRGKPEGSGEGAPLPPRT